MPEQFTAEEGGIVSRDRVTVLLRSLLQARVNIERLQTVEQISQLSGVKVRAIRSYMANDPLEVREPPLSNALSIAVVLGAPAVNAVLSLIGYGGAKPLDEPEAIAPGMIVAELITHTGTIARAAADGRFDHTEKPDTTKAADAAIAVLLPLSSMADAG